MARRVVVLEKSLAVGVGGMLAEGVRNAMAGIQQKDHTVIAGLGGRAISKASLVAMIESAQRGELEALSFLDLRWDVVRRELQREQAQRRAGPIAENILRDLASVAPGALQ
jgi:pyruvate ferredoxin oxidoreductase alpha subunit